MQLLVYINSHAESAAPWLSALSEAGLNGATIVDCKGMLTALEESSSVEPAPIAGSLLRFVNNGHANGKMVFMALADEDVPRAKEIICRVTDGQKRHKTGVMFTLPITDWEGLGHN